jgi:hypothetical protein
MTTQAQAIKSVLDRIRGAIGTGETPNGSNHNFITEWYNAQVAKIGDGPWCEMTNTWGMWTGGAKALKVGRAYTVYAVEDAQKGANGSSWHWGVSGMKAGDQVYYDWSGKKMSAGIVDHTGTVEQILGDGTFYVLEGNTTGNVLKRQRRDKTFVVGYARFDWAKLVTADPPPPVTPSKPSTKPTPNRDLTKHIQVSLEVPSDGQWGSTTDARAQLMRTAAQAHAGYPKRIVKSFNIKTAQNVIDTTPDGVWGPRSQASLYHWVKEFQGVLGQTKDGQWGPKTDNAYLAARQKNLNNF